MVIPRASFLHIVPQQPCSQLQFKKNFRANIFAYHFVVSQKLQTQLVFTCSKSTVNNMWNLFKVNNKDIRTTLLTEFTHCSVFSIVAFEQVNADWKRPLRVLHTIWKHCKVAQKNIVSSFSDSGYSYWGFWDKLVNEKLKILTNCHFHYQFSEILSPHRQLHAQS